MKVLMATDGSRRATEALLTASRMLAAPEQEVDLMCVVPKAGDGTHPGHQQRLERRARHVLDSTGKTLAAEGLTARPVIRTGSPARVLVAAARDYDVTVVAATSHRSGPMAGLGPVAGRVAEHSGGTVLLMREGRGEPGLRILAAVDGSSGSFAALECAAGLVDLSNADVTLLHVVETPWLHAISDQEWLENEELADQEYFRQAATGDRTDAQAQEETVLVEEFRREANDIMAEARLRLPPRTAVNPVIADGFPAEEILAEADRGDYDLVVIGASGSTDLKHRILGSVSSRVAWNAPCSVLLVGAGTERPPAA
jgi:nucleotide-binding universal stress UspA family protein